MRDGPVRVRVREDAPADVHEAELGVLGHDADVALHRQGEPDADGVTVDRRDDGLPHVPRRRLHGRSGEVVTLRRRERVAARLHVGAGAEGAPGAGDDDRAHAVVGVARGVGAAEAGAHGAAERVEPIGSVQGDDCDTVCRLDGDRIVVHDYSARPARWPSKMARSAGRAATASPTRTTSGTRSCSVK